MWYQGIVLKGQQTGRTIGFPTANLDPHIIPQNTKTGVYKAIVKYEEKEYIGALYFGPRHVRNETFNVLEIHILDFQKEIYGDTISFTVGRYLRGVKKPNSLEELKQLLKEDILLAMRI